VKENEEKSLKDKVEAVVAPEDGGGQQEPESDKFASTAKPERWLVWPADAQDRWRLLIALAVIVFAALAGLSPAPQHVDPYARINLIVLGLVVASWIVGLCSTISPRKWASIFGLSGLAIWFAGIYFASGSVVRALLDMVTFW